MDEELDYAWKFTGSPYLDGIIFGAGTIRNKNKILINVSECPYGIIEEIEKKFNEIGYDAGCEEMPNAVTSETDMRILAAGPYPIFTKKNLPRFKERRIIVDETPIEFLYGFFTVRSRVKLKAFYPHHKFEEDAILISTFLPKDDMLQLLYRVGITEYVLNLNNIYIERKMFLGLKPFERIYQEFLKEYKFFGNNITKADIVTEAMERLKKETWKEHKTIVFDEIEYYE